MERVNKGEKYWLIHIMWNRIYVTDITDMHYECDRDNWNQGNYFNTKEEAEAVARKIKAVLKGADVIEMPSEEEINNDATYYGYAVAGGCIERGYIQDAFEAGAEWLKSKIVK